MKLSERKRERVAHFDLGIDINKGIFFGSLK